MKNDFVIGGHKFGVTYKQEQLNKKNMANTPTSVVAGCKNENIKGQLITCGEDREALLWDSKDGSFYHFLPSEIHIKDTIYNVKEKDETQIYYIFTEKVKYYQNKFPGFEYFNMKQRLGRFGEVQYIFILKKK